MQTEDLIFDTSSQWKVVEEISEHLPDVATSIFANTFIKETVAIPKMKEVGKKKKGDGGRTLE
jgi:hypothetical protein